MTSSESLADRLLPPGSVGPLEKEFARNAGPVLGLVLPAAGVSIALSVQSLRSALLHDSKLVRFLLIADLLADAGVIGYGSGKARQLAKTETPEETRARRAKLRPIRYARPVRGAVATALATSRTRSVPASVAAGLLTYAFSLALQHGMRALRPRLLRATELSEQFKAERLAKQQEALASEAGVEDKAPHEGGTQVGSYTDGTPVSVSPEDRMRLAIEKLERLGRPGGKSVLVEDEPRGYATPAEASDESWTGMTTASKDAVRDALTRKLAEKERLRKGLAYDAMLNPDQAGRERRREPGVDDIVE